MIHWLWVGAEITVVLAVWGGIVFVLAFLGWECIADDERGYGTRDNLKLHHWVGALLLWLLAGAVFFGGMLWVGDRAHKNCDEKGGHLVTVGKTTVCRVDTYRIEVQPR